MKAKTAQAKRRFAIRFSSWFSPRAQTQRDDSLSVSKLRLFRAGRTLARHSAIGREFTSNEAGHPAETVKSGAGLRLQAQTS